MPDRLPTLCIHCRESFPYPEYRAHLQACIDAHKNDSAGDPDA